MGGRGWGLFLGFCFFCFFSFLGGSEGISSYAPSDSVLCKYSRRTNLTAGFFFFFFFCFFFPFSFPLLSASERRSPFLKTELVLSVCQENLSWLEPEEISKFSAVTLYKKCHQETVNDLPDEYPNIRGRVSLQTMKNRGSCDGTYLHHILTQFVFYFCFVLFFLLFSFFFFLFSFFFFLFSFFFFLFLFFFFSFSLFLFFSFSFFFLVFFCLSPSSFLPQFFPFPFSRPVGTLSQNT